LIEVLMYAGAAVASAAAMQNVAQANLRDVLSHSRMG
jgi:hypothetical protein